MTRLRNIDTGLLLLRIALGVVFIMHGWQKLTGFGVQGVTGMVGSLGIPFPTLNAVALIATELVGGVALLAGVLSRFAGLATAFAMLVATSLVHWPNGFFLPAGYEFTLTLALASLAIVFAGPGRYSLDALFWRQRPASTVATLEHREHKAAA